MVLDILQNVAALLVTLAVLIAVHEYGHFQVAKWCGVHVERFSIGFGKAFLRREGAPPVMPAEQSGRLFRFGSPLMSRSEGQSSVWR